MRQHTVPLSAPPGICLHCLGGKDDLIVAQLLAMERRLWKKSDSWGPMLEKEIKRRNTFLLYAIPSSTATAAATPASQPDVLGYLLYTTSGLVAHISKVLVVPQARRQGIGKALVHAAIQIAHKERKVGSVTLHVDADNEPALALYGGLGFQSEGLLEVNKLWDDFCIGLIIGTAEESF